MNLCLNCGCIILFNNDPDQLLCEDCQEHATFNSRWVKCPRCIDGRIDNDWYLYPNYLNEYRDDICPVCGGLGQVKIYI